MRYNEKLSARIQACGSALCVGLDPRPDEMSIAQTEDFLRRVIEETSPYAAAFKPNMAYFEAMGVEGLSLLERLFGVIPSDIALVLDAKRGDIGETQKYYARAYFERWDVDAVTLNPFMGYDTLEPFLDWKGKGIYLLGVTSNAGSADIERQVLQGGRKVYELVGDMVTRAQSEARLTDVGLVVGLTNADKEVLHVLPDAPLLIPGMGAQGGDISSLAESGRKAPSLVNVSRGVLYQDAHLSYAQKAQQYAKSIAEALRA